MSDHDGFLQELLSALPNQVFLVNRWARDDLPFGDDPALRVFIPDLHWMSAASEKAYTGYHFNGKGPMESGETLFGAFLSVLERYRRAHNPLEVFQLGDRFDLWREATLGGDDPVDLYRRIRDDAGVKPLADRLDVLATQYLRGNHDHWLNHVDPKISDPPSHEELSPAGGAICLTHGHQYDQIEQMLPDELKAWAVQRYPKAPAEVQDIGPFEPKTLKRIKAIQAMRARNRGLPIYPDPRPDGARLVRSPQEVSAVSSRCTAFLDVTGFCHDPGDANDFENHINFLRFAGKIYDFEEANDTKRVLYVIGHTHHARLFVDKHPKNEGPLVTMDCGGWVEQCTVVSTGAAIAHAAPAAQFGLQCGNDLRIYQIGGNDKD
jgi:UDP-2,3-diacylglucosamine pyrophosphatase LpxH